MNYNQQLMMLYADALIVTELMCLDIDTSVSTSMDTRIQLWSPIRRIHSTDNTAWIDEEVMDHIAKVLEMIDLIYIPVWIPPSKLRMKVFLLSLADDARQRWINEGEGKITVWEELVEKFFYKFYLESYNEKEEMLDEGVNWGIDQLDFISAERPYLKTSEKNETEKDNELSQPKCKCSKTSNSIDEQPYKRICKAEKFEAGEY
ncbi:hypothetical protein Tco_0671880 [Tanacetum coccineum]